MTAPRLSDEELRRIEHAASDAPMLADCDGCGVNGNDLAHALAEVRHYRALLATEMPDSFSDEEVTIDLSRRGSIALVVDARFSPNQAIGFAAELIRAALAARSKP